MAIGAYEVYFGLFLKVGTNFFDKLTNFAWVLEKIVDCARDCRCSGLEPPRVSALHVSCNSSIDIPVGVPVCFWT